MDRSDKLFFALVAIALIAAIPLAVQRIRTESANRVVDIIVDADDARQVAAAAGRSLVDVFADLARAGATSVAVREITVGGLADSHQVFVRSASAETELLAPNAAFADAISASLRARLPHARVGVGQIPISVTVNLDMDQLADVPVMLRVEDLAAARQANLRVVARLVNFPSVSPEAIDAAAAMAEAAGAHLVVFDLEQVLGYDGLIADTSRALQRHHLNQGLVEMVDQSGDRGLARRDPSRVVRVHSISDSDMEVISPDDAIRRYARAVRERGIRACYVRLLLRARADPLASNARYVAGIARAIASEGYTTGEAEPLRQPAAWPPRWLQGLVLVGIPAAFVLLVRRIVPLSEPWAWALLGGSVALGVIVVVATSRVALPLAGLAAACVFPALGTTIALQRASQSAGSSSARETWSALGGLALASGITLVGGILIVGLFSDVAYLSGITQFRGVKLAYVAPLVVVVGVVIANLPGRREPLASWWSAARAHAAAFFGRHVTVLEALIIGAALGAAAFAVMRSGNQPAMPPSGLELKARALLESVLTVRPRTKEFLIGYPALMLGLALSMRGRRLWLPFLALLAGVGQVSLLNTFCHFHSPLLVSLVRSAHGLWIGAALGAAVVVISRLADRRVTAAEGR